MRKIEFQKMHGLGNDFVILDNRDRNLHLDPGHIRWLADRRRGIGCDQLILLHPPRETQSDLFMQIYNPDGSEAEACGNATRCVASLLFDQGKDHALIETIAGTLDAERSDGMIAVDMGPVKMDWREIPLSQSCDTNHLPLVMGSLKDGVAVNIGNPHAVFFVENADSVPLAELGPKLEHHPLFPNRANIEIVTVINPRRLRLRVWERGAGITQACGSGACAGAIAAHRRGLAERKVEVELDGGMLAIEWMKDNHVKMSGPVAHSFSGQFVLER